MGSRKCKQCTSADPRNTFNNGSSNTFPVHQEEEQAPVPGSSSGCPGSEQTPTSWTEQQSSPNTVHVTVAKTLEESLGIRCSIGAPEESTLHRCSVGAPEELLGTRFSIGTPEESLGIRFSIDLPVTLRAQSVRHRRHLASLLNWYT
eukprot:gene3116-4041_t